jgi:DNA-binding protein H-NS
MKDRDLEKMQIDDLWDLDQRIIEVLDQQAGEGKAKAAKPVGRAWSQIRGSPKDVPQRRPYPKVEPKYRNPRNPLETWSGRGRTPRWAVELLANGANLEEFRIQ